VVSSVNLNESLACDTATSSFSTNKRFCRINEESLRKNGVVKFFVQYRHPFHFKNDKIIYLSLLNIGIFSNGLNFKSKVWLANRKCKYDPVIFFTRKICENVNYDGPISLANPSIAKIDTK
tara:strand:- start:1679 stop:2041 length:363 start_codon:yes stop_codon:yes gene_type:complete